MGDKNNGKSESMPSLLIFVTENIQNKILCNGCVASLYICALSTEKGHTAGWIFK